MTLLIYYVGFFFWKVYFYVLKINSQTHNIFIKKVFSRVYPWQPRFIFSASESCYSTAYINYFKECNRIGWFATWGILFGRIYNISSILKHTGKQKPFAVVWNPCCQKGNIFLIQGKCRSSLWQSTLEI